MRVAPFAPVADWLAVPDGAAGGTFRDLVTGVEATVTRTTAKTVYDATTGRIHDVPAGSLAVRPRQDGKRGYEAVIEEARTNLLFNSYGAAHTSGLWNGWSSQATTIEVLPSDLYGNEQRLGRSVTGDDYNVFVHQTAPGTVAAGESLTYSLWLDGSVSGPGTLRMAIIAYDVNLANLGSVSAIITLPEGAAERFSINYSSLPGGASYVRGSLWVLGNTGTTTTYSIGAHAAQLEKGAFATSYIPTTTEAVTRDADVVTVPTTEWDAAKGTFVAAAGEPQSGSEVMNAIVNSDNYLILRRDGGSPYKEGRLMVKGSGLVVIASKAKTLPGFTTHAGKWTNGAPAYAYIDGEPGTATANCTTPTSLPASAFIGSNSGASLFCNAPISRLTVYDEALTDAQVLEVTDAVKDGPFPDGRSGVVRFLRKGVA